MIIYSKTLWGLPLLTRIYGSALPRALAPAVVAGLITLGLTFVNEEVRSWWSHPFAYNAFVLLVSFVLTFRSNYAYNRHWEAYSNMQVMMSKWVDAAMQIVMFDRHPQRPQPGCGTSPPLTAAEHSQHRAFVAELVHMISLLHAVSCQALRRDPDLHNLIQHSKETEAPPSDPAQLRSPNSSGSAAAAGGGGSTGSNEAAAAAAAAAVSAGAAPSAAAAAAEDEEQPDSSSISNRGIMSSWGRGTNIVGSANWRDIFMLRGSSETIRKYNAAQPLPVIGGTSLDELASLGCSRHFYSSDWEEMSPQQQQKQQQALPRARSLSNLFVAAHSSSNGRDREYGFHRSNSNLTEADDTPSSVTDTGAVSDHSHSHHPQQQHYHGHVTIHTKSLGALTSRSFSFPRSRGSIVRVSSSNGEGSNGGKYGLKRLPSTRFVLISRNCSCCKGHLPYMDRPLLVMAWLHELLLQRQSEGGLVMPAPILSRVYACLSDGLQGFEQCRKLADTPFPFPWAQFVLVMLVLFTLTLPLLVLAYVPNRALAVVLTVVTVATYWTVNEVARDVEDPFLYEPNDMPLANSQYHMNELLLSLAHAHRPSSSISSLRRAATPYSRSITPTAFTKQHPQQQQRQHQQQAHQPSHPQRQQQQQQPQQRHPVQTAEPDAASASAPMAAAAAAAAAAARRPSDDASNSIGLNSDSSLAGHPRSLSPMPAQQQHHQQHAQLWHPGVQVTPYPEGSDAAAPTGTVAAAAEPLQSFGSITSDLQLPLVQDLQQGGTLGPAESSLGAWQQQQQRRHSVSEPAARAAAAGERRGPPPAAPAAPAAASSSELELSPRGVSDLGVEQESVELWQHQQKQQQQQPQPQQLDQAICDSVGAVSTTVAPQAWGSIGVEDSAGGVK